MVRKRVLRRVPGCYIELQISNKKLKHKAMLQKRTELMLNTQMYESMRWSCTKVVLFGNTVGKGLGKMGGGGDYCTTAHVQAKTESTSSEWSRLESCRYTLQQ